MSDKLKIILFVALAFDPLDEVRLAVVRLGFLAFVLLDERVFFGLLDPRAFGLGFERVLVCAMSTGSFLPRGSGPVGSVPVGQLRLAAARTLLVELGLDLGSFRLLLGDRGLGAALVRALPVMANVVVLRLALNLREFTLPAFLARSGNDNRENDQRRNDNCDYCERRHLSSFGLLTHTLCPQRPV